MKNKKQKTYPDEFSSEKEFLNFFDNARVDLSAMRDLMNALSAGMPFKKCCIEDCNENYRHYWVDLKRRKQNPICSQHLRDVENGKITQLLISTEEDMDDDQVHIAKMWKSVVKAKNQ